ncbi:hypothetical protein SAMN05421753_12435 [Planctomicrobium piriforme]|uniref:Uncharacterized protein n=1 Tax=Planctomicrobium piriforme TaxID=1576369 RepID=A0A1I3SIC2_9PLAN|nr:hypothetical protein SAMN05421753_12435 [Planctomicrobium piriforme]
MSKGNSILFGCVQQLPMHRLRQLGLWHEHPRCRGTDKNVYATVLQAIIDV